MQAGRILFFSLALVSLSCTVPKDARQLKRATKDWRTSPAVLQGYGDSPFGGTIITLRKNEKFEMTATGFGMVWFEAGTWALKQDTIKLSFVDSKQTITKTARVYLDRHMLFIQHEDSKVKLRVMLNKLVE